MVECRRLRCRSASSHTSVFASSRQRSAAASIYDNFHFRQRGGDIVSTAQPEAYEERKLPIIDVSGLHGGAIDRGAVARELRLACTNTGFFYITGHGIPTGLVDRVFQQSGEFFALPMEQKLALSMTQSACRHGYEPLKAQTLEVGAPPDLKEGFLAGEDLAAD